MTASSLTDTTAYCELSRDKGTSVRPWHTVNGDGLVQTQSQAWSISGGKAGGSLRTNTQLTLCSDEPSPSVCTSIHLEGKSCGHIRYQFECLISMTLLQGDSGVLHAHLGQAVAGVCKQPPLMFHCMQ